MRKYMKIFALLALLASVPAFAQTQTFEVDFSRLPEGMDRETVEAMCDTSFTLDSTQDLAKTFIAQKYGNPKAELIEKSRGSISGADKDAFNGDYLTRVFIVKQDGIGAYPYGIYYAVTITQYGEDAARKGFELNTNLLNYRGSAELAEDFACENLSFIKK